MERASICNVYVWTDCALCQVNVCAASVPSVWEKGMESWHCEDRNREIYTSKDALSEEDRGRVDKRGVGERESQQEMERKCFIPSIWKLFMLADESLTFPLTDSESALLSALHPCLFRPSQWHAHAFIHALCKVLFVMCSAGCT